MELKELYQEIILDHAKNPRNKGKCETLCFIEVNFKINSLLSSNGLVNKICILIFIRTF